MDFDLLGHELDTLKFYENLIKETNDIELKKELLTHHAAYLVSLHEIEKDYRQSIVTLEQNYDNNSVEVEKQRISKRAVRHSTQERDRS